MSAPRCFERGARVAQRGANGLRHAQPRIHRIIAAWRKCATVPLRVAQGTSGYYPEKGYGPRGPGAAGAGHV